jgi:hypothetical protein
VSLSYKSDPLPYKNYPLPYKSDPLPCTVPGIHTKVAKVYGGKNCDGRRRRRTDGELFSKGLMKAASGRGVAGAEEGNVQKCSGKIFLSWEINGVYLLPRLGPTFCNLVFVETSIFYTYFDMVSIKPHTSKVAPHKPHQPHIPDLLGNLLLDVSLFLVQSAMYSTFLYSVDIQYTTMYGIAVYTALYSTLRCQVYPTVYSTTYSAISHSALPSISHSALSGTARYIPQCILYTVYIPQLSVPGLYLPC